MELRKTEDDEGPQTIVEGPQAEGAGIVAGRLLAWSSGDLTAGGKTALVEPRGEGGGGQGREKVFRA